MFFFYCTNEFFYTIFSSLIYYSFLYICLFLNIGKSWNILIRKNLTEHQFGNTGRRQHKILNFWHRLYELIFMDIIFVFINRQLDQHRDNNAHDLQIGKHSPLLCWSPAIYVDWIKYFYYTRSYVDISAGREECGELQRGLSVCAIIIIRNRLQIVFISNFAHEKQSNFCFYPALSLKINPPSFNGIYGVILCDGGGAQNVGAHSPALHANTLKSSI